MRQATTDWPTSRVSLMPITCAAIALAGSVLILSTVLVHASPPLIHAVGRLDVGVVLWLNGFARQAWWFDVLVYEVAYSIVLQGVMVALFWGAWFASGDPSAERRKRETLLSSLIGVYATVVLAIALRATLPFRARPAEDPTIVFQAPFTPFGSTLHSHSTSLPAGHAAVFFALAVGLWSISVRLGLVGTLVAFFSICLPRIYIGLHYPSDILIGAVLGIVTVVLVNETLRGRSLMPWVLAWSKGHPAAFYGLFFLFSLDVATEFSSVRGFLRLLQSSHINKLVMLALGVVTS
jgi:undecaprenyl-diphosphatase